MGTTMVNRQGLDELTRRIQALKGTSVEFGIPSPAPAHAGKPGKPAPAGLTTAQVLAWIEFGPGNGPTPSAPKPKTARAKARLGMFGRFGRRFRASLRKVVGGFRSLSAAFGSGGRKGRPVPRQPPPEAAPPEPEESSRERPIIRWVAEAKRGEMRALVRQVGHAVVTGQDPEPRLERLRQALIEWSRNRIIDVGAVDTGQTRDAITAVIRRP